MFVINSSVTRTSILGLLFILLLAGIAVVSMLGAVSIPLISVLSAELTEAQQAVLYSIRLPRIFLAGIVGAALAVSGAAMQGLFRNPLADPSLIGIASGSALAVAITIVLIGSNSNVFGLYGLSVSAFLGGIITCYLIAKFAKLTGSFSVTYMLLAGIAINALAGAGTGFLTYLSNDEQLRALTFWTMGNVGGATWIAVIVTATITIPIVLILMRNARALNVLLLGEEEAQHLGIDSERLKHTVMICTALSVGVAVAMTGIIGFVGLIVPHLIRLLIGPDHQLLIPASAILGALLLIVADTLARTLLVPSEIPVGILTSFVGGPFFLWLLIKQYHRRFGI